MIPRFTLAAPDDAFLATAARRYVRTVAGPVDDIVTRTIAHRITENARGENRQVRR